MNEKIVCEVLLRSYKDLEALCEIADQKILSWALKQNADMFQTIERMNKCINEKIAYYNIKVLIDEAIKNIGHCEELKYNFLKGISSTKLENIIELKTYEYKGQVCEYKNKRNAFVNRIRTQKKNLFNYILRTNNHEKLFNLIKDSGTLMHRYNTILKRKKQPNNFAKNIC